MPFHTCCQYSHVFTRHLGTHSIQNLSINNSSLSGAVFTTVAFASGSNARGHLIILISKYGSYMFVVSYRPANTLAITDLSNTQYTAAVFDIAPNGLPTRQAAATMVFTIHTDIQAVTIKPGMITQMCMMCFVTSMF